MIFLKEALLFLLLFLKTPLWITVDLFTAVTRITDMDKYILCVMMQDLICHPVLVFVLLPEYLQFNAETKIETTSHLPCCSDNSIIGKNCNQIVLIDGIGGISVNFPETRLLCRAFVAFLIKSSGINVTMEPYKTSSLYVFQRSCVQPLLRRMNQHFSKNVLNLV